MIGGVCIKNVLRVEGPTTVAKKRSESVILAVSLLQPISSLLSGIM